MLVSDYSSHKKRRVGKMGGVFLKKGGGGGGGGGGSHTNTNVILTNPFQCYLSLSVWCVSVLFIYTIPVSIICFSQEEPSLIASNPQIHDFYK